MWTDFNNSFTFGLIDWLIDIFLIIYKKLQTIYLMLYKRQIKNCKNQKYKHERIR